MNYFGHFYSFTNNFTLLCVSTTRISQIFALDWITMVSTRSKVKNHRQIEPTKIVLVCFILTGLDFYSRTVAIYISRSCV